MKRLAAQSFDRGSAEVIVAVPPGGGDVERVAAHAAIEGPALTMIAAERDPDPTQANRALDAARGRWTLFLDENLIPDAGLLGAHAEAQGREPDGAVVVGACPRVPLGPERLFDRLVRETGIVPRSDQFSGDADAAERVSPASVQHAWALNLSAPTEALRRVGGFAAAAMGDYREIDLAWRLRERAGLAVVRHPEARAEHACSHTPDACVESEARLGHAALAFARSSPAAAMAFFGRDVAEPDELAYSRAFVRRERPLAERLLRTLRATAHAPAAHADGPGGLTLLRSLYESHLMLRRFAWRSGLIAAHEGAPVAGLGIGELGLPEEVIGRSVMPRQMSLVGAV